MSEDMRRSNVIGGLKTQNDEGVMITKWKHGFAGEAIECANQNPNGCILVLEEGNQPRGEDGDELDNLQKRDAWGILCTIALKLISG